MRCPSCNSENRDDATFCGDCASALATEVICVSCKRANPQDQKFCDGCGQRLDEAATPDRTPTPEPSPALPSSFASGRYDVKRFLGEGGRKRVYLAHDDRLDRDVAIAIIKTEGLDEAGLERVRREAQTMGRLGDHPHIVTIHDIGDENGQPYIVSQHMAGGDLSDRLRQSEGQRLELGEALRIANEIRLALEYAHSHGVIHRDLKPGNVWLTEDGTAKLGDFGLAISLDLARMTSEGMMVGTVAYMPPEQAMGRKADARSDLYSLGCMLYEMLAGRPPFLGDDTVSIISQHINTAPVAPSWHNQKIPKVVESLIMRLLAKNPDERPESAAAIPETWGAVSDDSSVVAERISEEANPLDRLAAGVFVGRDAEMDELRAGLEDSLSGRGRLLMLVGEPGIGKTRTSEELATYAGLRGAQVLWGKCYEGEGAPAYWPWVQAIRSYVHDRDPKELMSEMGPGAADIAEVVSEVKERLPGLPAAAELEPEQARFRLFDSITTFLKNVSSGQPVVLILDDLHWADKPSLLLLQFMARELSGSRLLVLGTYRDVELGRAHPLSQTLGELAREGLSQRTILRGLSELDVARFIEITAGTKPPEALVQAVYRETEGNPFFVNEIVRLLVADGRLEKPEEVTSWSVTIPQGVREVVGRRLDHLSEECNKLLTIGAVLGREFTLAALERVSGLEGDRLLEAVEEALGARVITEVPQEVSRYSFAHALIKETLYEELTATRRVRLHQQVAGELEALYGDAADQHADELAYHYGQAAAIGGPEKLVKYATLAGRQAASRHAYEEAIRYFKSALTAREDAPPDNEWADIQYRLGLAQQSVLQIKEALQRQREVFLYYADKGDIERAVRVAENVGSYTPFLSRRQWRVLDRALEMVEPGSEEEGRLRSCRGFSHGMLGDIDEAEPDLDRGLEIALATGDERGELRALSFRSSVDYFQWRPKSALEHGLRTIELANELEDAAVEGLTRFYISGLLLSLGDYEQAKGHADANRALADASRNGYAIASATMQQGQVAFEAGEFDAAKRFYAEGLKVAPKDPRHLSALACLHSELGEIDEAVGYVQRLTSVLDEKFISADLALVYPLVSIAIPYCVELGCEGLDLSVSERSAQFVLSNPLLSPPLIQGMAHFGISGLALVRGDKDAAKREIDEFGLFGDLGVEFFRNSNQIRGRLLALVGELDQAVASFESVRQSHGEGFRVAQAWLAYDYATVLVDRGEDGDREFAQQLVQEALSDAEELGMKPLMERALRLKLELQGADMSSPETSIDAVAAVVEAEAPDLRRHASPDGTVTLLFSDIEGSTAKTEELGDHRWMEVLREHNTIIREQLAAHDGFEVKSEGDGFMLAFQSARKALQCAIHMQQAFAARNDSASESILVRMGLHTGEMIKEGDDFFGKHVNLAARIAGQASGGEILVSALLKELTASGGDIAFGDSRGVELKGLSGVQHMHLVNWN